MPLTDTAIRNAKPEQKAVKLSDGGGLFLLIQPNGTRLWRLAYRFAGKQKLLAFGIAMAATRLNEMGRWNPDAIERQLGHEEQNEVRRAYTHGAEYWLDEWQ